jgi:GNAT superfamily N-acetyltransferase
LSTRAEPSLTKRVEVTTWYLEMLQQSELRAVECARTDVRVERAAIPSPELSRFLYSAVGGHWYWLDRLSWDYARWLDYLDRAAVETLILYVSGTPAGYIELEAQAEDNVEVAYFGLLPMFTGQRLGGYLLSEGVAHAWAKGARRVWVHTCNLDGPTALANYQARGFRVYDQRTQWQDLPMTPPGPWPGAGVPPPAV